jgi:hypothetical protein
MKIRIADQSITKLNADTQAIKTETLAAINSASTAQIAALATTVGVPVTASISNMRDRIYEGLVQIFDFGFEPSRKQQIDIINILSDIRNNTQVTLATPPPPSSVITIPSPPGTPVSSLTSTPSSTPAGTPSSTPSQFSNKNIFLPQSWASMTKPNRTILLRMMASNYLTSGKTIKQGTDATKMTSNWEFIMGDTKLISVKDVKARMLTGNYILSTKDYTIEKV